VQLRPVSVVGDSTVRHTSRGTYTKGSVVKIYLAGPIHGRTDLECKHWRSVARSYIECAGHEVLDPMDRDYRGFEEQHATDLVDKDKREIESADAVLVNANRPGWGTAMEVLYGKYMGKRVVAFATHTNAPSLSPWLQCHTNGVFDSIEHAIGGLLDGSTKGIR